MKYIFTLFAIILTSLSLQAQVQVSLNVDPNPTPQISSWVDRDDLAIVTVINSNPELEGTEYRIKVTMNVDGGQVLETDNTTSIQTLGLGVETYLADEIIPYSSVNFNNNSFKNKVLQTGLLPAGEYEFCVSLIDLDGNVISTPEVVCQPMFITDYQMPELLNPIGDMEIQSAFVPATLFQWTPLSPTPPAEDGVKYLLAVMEIQPGQSASQAFFVNYPIIEEEIEFGTQFNWPLDIDAPEEDTNYVWSIKPLTLDDNQYKQGSNGFVNIETFSIKGQNPDEDSGQEECSCDDAITEEPPVTVSQIYPDSPDAVTLVAASQLGLYTVLCDGTRDVSDYTFNTIVKWDNFHWVAENGTDVTHVYSLLPGSGGLHNVPPTIDVEVTIQHKTLPITCTTVYSYDVPQEIRDNINEVGDYTEGTVASNDTIYAGFNGEFEILTGTVTENDGKFTGEGTAWVEWLKARVAVEFDTITVNGNNKLTTGFIKAKIDDTAPVYPINYVTEVVANNAWAQNTAANVVTWAENTSGQSIDYQGLTAYSTPVEMPLGLNFPAGDQLAITEMVFKKSTSEFNAVAAKTTPASWGNPVQLVGFEVKELQFHPTNIDFSQGRLEIVDDLTVGNINGDIDFTFKKPSGSNSGCYLEWEDTGITEYGLEIESAFTRDWLLPVPDDGVSQSTASLSAVGTAWNDLILTGTLSESEIVETSGMIIKADSLAYDMSDTLNPPSINFPDDYPGETSNLFRGFYMKELLVGMPDTWQSNSGGPPEISIQDMIIDDVGVTLFGEANNVLQFPNAEVADLKASIDTVYVDIIASSLIEAGVKGKIGLPISKADSIQNPLKYHALFNNVAAPSQPKHFQLTIEPTGPIYASLLKGELELAETSNMVAKIDSIKKTFTLDLDGEFSWDDIDLGPVKNVSFGMTFQDMEMAYNSIQPTNKFQFDAGTWAFASPQKRLANFPVTVEDVEIENQPTTGNELWKGKLKIPVVLNLSDKIGGGTTLAVEGKVIDDSGSGGAKFKPEYIRTTIDSIGVDAKMAAVDILGYLKIRNDDPVYGNGFTGSLKANFKAVKIKASAAVEFGNTTYLNPNRYRYWRVEADVVLPPPGVSFLPGLAFRGFGGGAYRNMEATLSGTTYSFSPKKSSLGFNASAVLATTPKEETFNADVNLAAQFSSSDGLTFIGFTGDFFVGAGFDKRADAKINGDVAVTYDFPQQHFNMTANVNVNAPPITTPSPANLVLDVNGKTNKWYFKFGEPSNLNTVKVGGVNLYEYLMFGNDIPQPNGFTTNFNSAYYDIFKDYPNGSSIGSGGVGSNTETGKGFALGIGFKFSKADDKRLTKHRSGNKKHTVFYNLSAGAELNLGFLEYSGSCGGYSTVGINGWRAKGNLGFYGTASASVRKYRNNGSVQWNKDVASLEAGAWIQGEFPNPYWVKGAVDGSVSVLGDLINFSFHKEFEKGTRCYNGSAGSGAAVTQGDAAADQEQLLIKYVNPSQNYNFPETSPLIVRYGLTPNEVFDVSEQQGNGTIENRVFKLVVTKSLKKDDGNGNFGLVYTTQTTNNLGEYLYVISTASSGGTVSASLPSTGLAMSPIGGSSPGSAFGALPAMGIANMAMAPMSATYSSPSTGLGSGQATANTNMVAMGPATIYPATGHSGGGDYDNLPPEPDPVINGLETNKNYRFTVIATLKEYKNGAWSNALKNNGQPVTQTVVKSFRTGPMQISNPSTSTRQKIKL